MNEQLTIFENNLPANVEDLAKFILIGREKLVALRAEIRAIKRLDISVEVWEQKIIEAQGLAEALLEAEMQIGEITSLIPKTLNQYAVDTAVNRKYEQLEELGLHYRNVYRFEMLATYRKIVEQVIQVAREKNDIATRSEALKKITHFIKKENVTEAEREYEESIKDVKDFTEDIFNTDQKFNIIYADPPWQYWDGGFKNQSLHYPTMSMNDIKNLPVKNIADDNCILFLWVTFPILKECFEVIESWGFRYSTCGFVWLKKNKNTDSYFFGNGSWTRANVELCLIATKGTVTRIDASISQIVEAPISEHSEKPAIIRQLITDLVGALPRIELFSRSNENKDGWFNWGNKI